MDWDIPRAGTAQDDTVRKRAYRKLAKLLGARAVKECVSTSSVLPVETLELALEVAQLISHHGGTANVREARTIRTYRSARE
ncbi:hypothetical protein MUO79_09535 [Candidatus Bathyarchaeota archaeon]|nr:hypothetical protein [Candidatus Bathyarchaeota archaeon]